VPVLFKGVVVEKQYAANNTIVSDVMRVAMLLLGL
jgi:hypothetical protein